MDASSLSTTLQELPTNCSWKQILKNTKINQSQTSGTVQQKLPKTPQIPKGKLLVTTNLINQFHQHGIKTSIKDLESFSPVQKDTLQK